MTYKKTVGMCIALLLLGATFCYGQIESTRIKVIDTTKTLAETFSFISEEIGDTRVIALGEQTHSPDVSFEIRAKLIEYLIEYEGFNTILFEAGMFDLEFASINLKNSKNINDVQNVLYSFWGKTNYHNRLFEYFQSNIDKGKNLTFDGFDCKLTSRLVATSDIYTKALSKQLQDAVGNTTSIEYQEYLTIWKAIEENRKKGGLHAVVYPMSEPEKNKFLSLSKFFQKKLKESGNKYWSLIIKGIDESIAIYSDFTMEKAQSDPSLILKINNKRDSLMADNLQYLLKEKYSDKKVILVGANYHFVRNINKISPSNVAGVDFSKSVTMGQIISEEIDVRIFTIGFIAPEKYNCDSNSNNNTTSLGCLQQRKQYSIAYHPLNKWDLNTPDESQQQVIKLFMPQSASKHPNWNEVIDAVVLINKTE